MTNEKICPRCGNRNAGDAQFCNFCASPFAAGAPQPQPPQPPPPQPPDPRWGQGQQLQGQPQQWGGQQGGQFPPPQPQSSNKAMIAMVLVFVGLCACGLLANIPGAILAKMEMDAIKQGRAPATNLQLATWAFYGNIGVAVLSTLLLCGWFALGGMSMLSGYRF